MCGLFGFDFNQDIGGTARAVIAAGLCTENDHRGGHSWGYYAGRKLVKGLGTISSTQQAETLARYDRLMGHTRFATTGAKTIRNAHPFKIRGIVGAHNGMIYNHRELNTRYQRHCTVDSQHLFHHLANRAPLKPLIGYGALTYQVLKERPTTIYLGTFNGGELAASAILHEGEVAGVVYSSSGAALTRVLTLAGVEWERYTLAEGRVYAIQGGELYDTPQRLDVSNLVHQRYPEWMTADRCETGTA